MAGIFDRKFFGEIPRINPVDLPPGAAEYAVNCDFRYGDLRPLPADSEPLIVKDLVASLSEYPTYYVGEIQPTLAQARGLYYNRARNSVVCFPRPPHVALHTTNGLDRLFWSDGIAPKATSGDTSNTPRPEQTYASLAYGNQDKFDLTATYAAIGPDTPASKPAVLGDLALSALHLADTKTSSGGALDFRNVLRYGQRALFATLAADGSASDFSPSLGGCAVDWIDRDMFNAAWQKESGFYNKRRELRGAAIAPTGGGIAIQVQLFANKDVDNPALETPMGVVFSNNYGTAGAAVALDPAATVTLSSTSSLNNSSQYPTVAEYPELDTLSNSDLVAIQTQGEAMVDGEYYNGPAAHAKGIAATAVLTARGYFGYGTGAQQQNGVKLVEATAAVAPVGPYDKSVLDFGHRLSLSYSATKSANQSGVAAGSTRFDISAVLQVGEVDSRSYCYTYVNRYGEESAPSGPSEIINVDQGHCVRVSIDPPDDWKTATSAAFSSALPVIRVYRTVTGSGGNTQFHLFREVTFDEYYSAPRGATRKDLARPSDSQYPWFDWVDCLSAVNAQESLSTIGQRRPPNSITHLQAFGNGALCAISGDEILVSTAFKPYAWPIGQRSTAPGRILAAKALANGVVLGTVDGFAVVTGDPVSMSVTSIPSSSVMIYNDFKAIGEALVALTTDGIAVINGASVSTDMTEKVWTSAQWSDAWVSATGILGNIVSMEVHNKQLLLFGANDACMLDLTTGGITRLQDTLLPIVIPTPFKTLATCYAPALDAVFISTQDTANGAYAKIRKLFGGAGHRPLVYRSRKVRFEKPISLGAMKVVIDGNSYGQITLYGYGPDGVKNLINTHTFSSNNGTEQFFRFRAGALYAYYSYEVSGISVFVKEIHIAETMAEVANA